jgi:hypothetical protein
MYRTQAGLVCHRNPDETVRSVDRSTALRLNTGVHAKHPGQLLNNYQITSLFSAVGKRFKCRTDICVVFFASYVQTR